MTQPVALPSAIVISKATAPGAVSGQLAAENNYGNRLNFALAGGGAPEHGFLLLNRDGTYTYTPARDYLGTDSFSFTVTDAEGHTSTSTVAIDIAEEAPAVISGTAGADVLIGGIRDNMIDGGEDSYGEGGADMIDGGAGNDTLAGDYPATLYGGEGDDWLTGGEVQYGGAGDDVLDRDSYGDAYGGEGNDTLIGYTAARLYGGEGDDTFHTGGEAAYAYGGTGNDTIYTGGGYFESDYIFGDEGDDLIIASDAVYGVRGGDGNDTIDLSAGGGSAYGDAGSDALLGGYDARLYGGLGNDVITLTASGYYPPYEGGVAHGDEGNDRLTSENGNDFLFGDAGDDVLLGGAGADVLNGGSGADTLDGGTGLDTLEGGAGNDTYFMASVADVTIEAVDGGMDRIISSVSQTLRPNFENIVLTGFAAVNGTGNGLDNWLTGNGAANVLVGNAGDDVLRGGAGADLLKGGSGDDTLDGGTGLDTLEGGAGNDTYIMASVADATVETASGGMDRVFSPVSQTLRTNFENLVLTGNAAVNGTGNGLDNWLTGNAAANVLTGNSGNDTVRGNAGDDLLKGGSGNDALVGGSGDDTLTGGLGVDWHRGGAGNDVFRFMHRSEGGDVITDFRNAAGNDDVFEFSAAGFASGLTAGTGLSASRFQARADNLAQDADDRFILRTTDKTLWFDANGSASGGLTMIADLDANAMLTSADIFLI